VKSPQAANAALDFLLRSGEPRYVGLFTAAPASDASGGAELQNADYVRQTITFGEPLNGQASNDAQVDFGLSTQFWGEVQAFGIWDAAAEGTLLFHDALLTARTVASGVIVRFPVGSLTLIEL
jgi:hypothetical protein